MEQAHIAADVVPAILGLLRELSAQPLRNLSEGDSPPQRVVVQQVLGSVLVGRAEHSLVGAAP
eukprot:2572536-Alexandrium_andersonii.AAC.1